MSSETPAIATKPKIILFTDFDGTVTVQDSNDYMTDNLGMGYEKRKAINDDILVGKTSFRDGFREMLDSIKKPFPECVEYLKQHIDLDPGFKDFYDWAKTVNIPVVIVSSGMEPIIRALIGKLIGEQAAAEIPIISNQVKVDPEDDSSWEIVYHDDSSFGHNKSLCIRPYAELPKDIRPTLLYAGDGVSDLSAAKETDLLFAKKGKDLIKYCLKEGTPYTEFETYKDIHDIIIKLNAGETSVHDINKNL